MGNPYVRTLKSIKNEEKYGIIDNNFQLIMPCKFTSISDFDYEQKIVVTDSLNGSKSMSLPKLRRKASRLAKLSVGMEYNAIVKAFKAYCIYVKIQGNQFQIPKKLLFKNIRQFKKGDSFVAKYLGINKNGYPTWETMDVKQTD